MITLTTVSGQKFYLNYELIYRVDESFDSIITLVSGKTLRVSETGEEIAEKMAACRRLVYGPERMDGK